MAIQVSKAIFLHIPKTGGTWVTNYFKETNMDHQRKEIELAHMHGRRLREIIGHTEDLVFCFVRHPLTWYRSYWQCRQELVPDRSGGYLDTIVDLPFQEFIEQILKNQPGYLTGFFSGYTERCRFVGKQENLRDDLDNLLRTLRIPYNRPYLFKRVLDNVIPSEEKYSYVLATEIMHAEKHIIETYNYNYLPTDVMSGI